LNLYSSFSFTLSFSFTPQTYFNADTANKEVNAVFEKIAITPNRGRSNFALLESQIPLIKFLLRTLAPKVSKVELLVLFCF
jgi:hypothetical protein